MSAENSIEIPGYIKIDSTISPMARIIYGDIAADTKRYGQCETSNAEFCRIYHIAKRSMSKWIKQLIEKGYIKRCNRNKHDIHRKLKAVSR